jgi:hypothetical protein
MAIVNRFGDLVHDINVYDVFGKCWKNQTSSVFRLHKPHQFLQADDGLSTSYKTFMTADEYTPWAKIPKFNIGGKKTLRDDEPPCVYQKPFIQYLNTASVRTQLHIDPSLNQTKWQICYPVNYT